MGDSKLIETVEKLESIILNVMYLNPEDRLISPDSNNLTLIKKLLEEIFEGTKCTEVLYTLNTDNIFFGVRVVPLFGAGEAISIFTTEEKMKFTKYRLEIDSKLFDINLDSSEITALIIHEIGSIINNELVIDNARAIIDLHLLNEDDVISIRDSLNYSQLLIYALQDTFYKISSAMFKEETFELSNLPIIRDSGLSNTIVSCMEKINNSNFGSIEDNRSPKTIILKWMFMVYKDMEHNSRLAKETLKDAISFTGSKLEKKEIEKTISAIDKINSQSIMEGKRIDKVLETKGFHSLCEVSLFKSLKSSGLRSIEDSYYEYKVRIKNCSTEEDAMYILRGINSRLGILEDYLYNTPDLSDSERKHWGDVAMAYRQLREELSKKKIWDKKNYGLFVDYDYLDNLDKNNNNYNEY